MKCKKQFRFHKLPIANLWEVHLEKEIWERLRQAAYLKKCSFSWISRYCVFRILRRKNFKISHAMEILSKEVKKNHHSSITTHFLIIYFTQNGLLNHGGDGLYHFYPYLILLMPQPALVKFMHCLILNKTTRE
jgi:hypothetical protein